MFGTGRSVRTMTLFRTNYRRIGRTDDVTLTITRNSVGILGTLCFIM